MTSFDKYSANRHGEVEVPLPSPPIQNSDGLITISFMATLLQIKYGEMVCVAWFETVWSQEGVKTDARAIQQQYIDILLTSESGNARSTRI